MRIFALLNKRQIVVPQRGNSLRFNAIELITTEK